MKLLQDEREVSRYGNLILTNKRLIQERIKGSNKITREFSIANLDSIIHFKTNKKVTLSLSIILIILGSFYIIYPSARPFVFLFLIAGIIGILAYLFRRENVEFRSKALIITEHKRGFDEFLENVRREVYKNRR